MLPSRRSVDVRKQRGAVRPARRGSGAAARGVRPCPAGARAGPSWAPAGMARFCSQSRVQAFCRPPGGLGRPGALRGRRARTGGAQGVFLPGALPRRCPRRPILAPSRDGAVSSPEARTGVLPASRWVQDVWEPCRASRPAQGGRECVPPGRNPADSAAPSLPGCLLGPAWDIPVLLSDTAHKLATLIYTMLRYGQECVDAGAEYHDRSSRWRWLARPVVNSGRRTGRLSHPVSAAVVSVPVAAFPFSPGGAARRPFLFLHLPPSPHGAVRAASFSPGRGLRSRGFRGGQRGGRRSFQRSLRRESRGVFRPSGPPVARPPAGPGGRRRFCRLFRRGRRFPRPVRHFPRPVRHFPRPARRSPRPVRPVFPHIFCLAPRAAYRRFTSFMVFCTLRRRQGCPARPQWPAEAVSLWLLTAPAPRPPRFFCALYIKGKKFLIPLYKRSRVERERERERERDVVLYIGGVIF